MAVPALPDDTPEEVRKLITRIDDDPDKLHADYTPAVWELIKVGEPALRPTLRLVLADNEVTRLHAQRVIEGVTLVQHGFVFGQGWKDPNGESKWKRFWIDLGGLDYEASLELRKASVTRWERWLSSRDKP